MSEVEGDEFQSGYTAGRFVGTLGAALRLLHWDSWGEPKNEWQRGFVLGYQDRVDKSQTEGEETND